MPENVVGKIPDFTLDEALSEGTGEEEVKEATTEEGVEEEKETPTDLPADTQPAQEGDDTGDSKQLQGLMSEREKLLVEIKTLRGQRREMKQQEIKQVDQKMDDLKDLYPQDVQLIDRILQARGYVTQEKAQAMFYKQVQDSELNKFLDKYPEYKAENDPHDLNWSALQREIGLYKMPSDPHKVSEILLRAHQVVAKVPSDRGIPAMKRQVEVASVGSRGAQRSSSGKTLDPDKRRAYEDGGWSEEEIKEIEERL